MKVKDIIKKDIFYLDVNDTVDYAIEEFSKKGLREAPILDNEKVVGIIEIGDLLNYLYENHDKLLSIKEIMKVQFCKTYLDTSLGEIKDWDFNV